MARCCPGWAGRIIVIASDPARGQRKLVSFDLDETLVDRNRAFRAWAAEFAVAH